MLPASRCARCASARARARAAASMYRARPAWNPSHHVKISLRMPMPTAMPATRALSKLAASLYRLCTRASKLARCKQTAKQCLEQSLFRVQAARVKLGSRIQKLETRAKTNLNEVTSRTRNTLRQARTRVCVRVRRCVRMSERACMRVYACVYACVHARAEVRGCVCACVRTFARARAHQRSRRRPRARSRPPTVCIAAAVLHVCCVRWPARWAPVCGPRRTAWRRRSRRRSPSAPPVTPIPARGNGGLL